MSIKTYTSQLLPSVVVFLVALPLCMGVAIASGVPPAMGLVSGIVGGIVVGSLAGSPLQVSGPAAGLAVIVYEIVNTHGLEALGIIVVLAGLMQAIAGKLKLGQWFRAVAPAVIYGMLAGIGVLIFGSQFHVMVDDVPVTNGLMNVLTIPSAIAKGLAFNQDTPHFQAASVGMLTLAVLVGWNTVRGKLRPELKAIPAPLLAVGAAVIAAFAFGLDIAYVTVPSSLSELFTLPGVESLSLLTNPAVLGSAAALAVIASAEALLCSLATDKLHDGDRADLDQELFAQGIGNTVSGFLGGLPVTGVIVRSTANIESGGTNRWSSVIHGVWLLMAVAAVPFLLEAIPVASLAAVLVYIGWKLVDPAVPKALLERGKGVLAVYLATVAAIVGLNLLQGLMIGVALSVMKLAWSFSHLRVETEAHSDRIDVHLFGAGTFVGLPKLARALERIEADQEVHIHLEHVDYVDHACFELLSDWRHQYENRGGTVVVEWDTLEERATYRLKEVPKAA